MRRSLRHERPPLHKARREAPRSEIDHDHHRNHSKETIKDQGVSNSRAFDPRNTKRNSATTDVGRELCGKIHAKMRFLEEDTRLMKEAILDCVKDRDLLMSEISHKLHMMMREHLSITNSECKLHGPPPRVFSFDPLKKSRKDIGLLGVLHQDPPPKHVARRAKKINVEAFDDDRPELFKHAN